MKEPDSDLQPSDCTLDTSVTDWVIEHPEALKVFEEMGIDYSCAGVSLGYACHKRGLDPDAVLKTLMRRITRCE